MVTCPIQYSKRRSRDMLYPLSCCLSDPNKLFLRVYYKMCRDFYVWCSIWSNASWWSAWQICDLFAYVLQKQSILFPLSDKNSLISIQEQYIKRTTISSFSSIPRHGRPPALRALDMINCRRYSTLSLIHFTVGSWRTVPEMLYWYWILYSLIGERNNSVKKITCVVCWLRCDHHSLWWVFYLLSLKYVLLCIWI